MRVTIHTTFKRRFFAGLLISIPAIITFMIIGWFFKFVDGFLEPIYYNILGYHVRGIGFISAVILIFIVGFFSTNVIGRWRIVSFERTILRFSGFKRI